GINVMVRFRMGSDPFLAGAQPGVGWFIDDIEFTNPQSCPIELTKVVSTKTHNGTAFEVLMPPAGALGVEPRRGGGSNNGEHQVVFKFGKPVTFTGASVAPAAGKTAEVASSAVSGNDVLVNLRNVSNAQTLTITLAGVNAGGASADITVPMGVLVGDTTGDGTVNSGDSAVTRSRSGQLADVNNFRSDVNVDGAVNSGDAMVVRSNSGTTVTP
ncbi:MAG TPA: dockerin type I domain-containing protein, partial [Chthoniobacterales bacterium]